MHHDRGFNRKPVPVLRKAAAAGPMNNLVAGFTIAIPFRQQTEYGTVRAVLHEEMLTRRIK